MGLVILKLQYIPRQSFTSECYALRHPPTYRNCPGSTSSPRRVEPLCQIEVSALATVESLPRVQGNIIDLNALRVTLVVMLAFSECLSTIQTVYGSKQLLLTKPHCFPSGSTTRRLTSIVILRLDIKRRLDHVGCAKVGQLYTSHNYAHVAKHQRPQTTTNV